MFPAMQRPKGRRPGPVLTAGIIIVGHPPPPNGPPTQAHRAGYKYNLTNGIWQLCVVHPCLLQFRLLFSVW